MADAISITFDTVKLDSRLMRLARTLGDPTPMLEELGQEGERIVKMNFRTGGRPDKWKPSRERKKDKAARLRLEAKGKQSKGQKTLVDTGNLQGSISHQVMGREVAVGSNVIYGRIHHFGGTINHPGGTPYLIFKDKLARFLRKDGNYPKGVRFTAPHPIKIPARPWLVFPPGSSTKFNRIIRSHVEAV